MRLREALREFGLDPEAVAEAQYHRDDVAGYVEVHIEQGPVLEAEDRPVGVVTSIAGATRMRVEVMGRAGHAGTVPHGPPVRCARRRIRGGDRRRTDLRRHSRGGRHGRGAPGHAGGGQRHSRVVEFSVDVRAGSDGVRRRALGRIGEAFAAIEERRGVLFDSVTTHETRAAQCSPWLMHCLGRAIEAEGLDVRELPSGAGHDAMAMAHLTAVGMLFVRCKEGISHHPAESMTEADAEVAARVLLRFLEEFDPGEREPDDRAEVPPDDGSRVGDAA